MKRIILTLVLGICSIALSMAQGEPAPSRDLDSTLSSPYIINLQELLSLSEIQSRTIADIHRRYSIHIEMAKELEAEESEAELGVLMTQRKMEIMAALDETQQQQFMDLTDGTRKRNKMKRSSPMVDNPSN